MQITLDEAQVAEIVKHGKSSDPQRMQYTKHMSEGTLPMLINVESDLKHHVVEFETKEFSFKCKLIKQPDYGSINLRVVPDSAIVEMRSLRDYLVGYRDLDIYQEEAAFGIFVDYVHTCKPLAAEMEMIFMPRGGMGTKVNLRYVKDQLTKQTYGF